MNFNHTILGPTERETTLSLVSSSFSTTRRRRRRVQGCKTNNQNSFLVTINKRLKLNEKPETRLYITDRNSLHLLSLVQSLQIKKYEAQLNYKQHYLQLILVETFTSIKLSENVKYRCSTYAQGP